MSRLNRVHSTSHRNRRPNKNGRLKRPAIVIAAPQAGSDTRDLLMSKADEGKEYLRRQTEGLRDSAGDLLDKGRDLVSKQKDQLTSAVEAGKQAYRDTVGAAGQPGGQTVNP